MKKPYVLCPTILCPICQKQVVIKENPVDAMHKTTMLECECGQFIARTADVLPGIDLEVKPFTRIIKP